MQLKVVESVRCWFLIDCGLFDAIVLVRPFSWLCQDLCPMGLVSIIYWRVVSAALFNRTPRINILIPTKMEIWFGQCFWCFLLSGLDMKECGDIKQIIKANAQLFGWLKNGMQDIILVGWMLFGWVQLKPFHRKKEVCMLQCQKCFSIWHHSLLACPEKKSMNDFAAMVSTL